MTERVYAPLIVGITGKRNLAGQEEAVRRALQDAFDLLDKHFPHTPKILLSALAQGADTIAAEEALARADQHKGKSDLPSWQVVAPLPLPLARYEEDFEEEKDKERLRKLASRVRTHVLPPLRRHGAGSPFEFGPPYEWDELARGSDSNPERTAHYEQVGLHISDECGLLIAVMSAGEAPGKVGGTARIVDYRVRAAFDDVRWDVVRRSQVLAPLPLDRPQPGPAWVIDLDKLDASKPSQLHAIEQWEPKPPDDHDKEGGGKHAVEIRKTSLTSRWHDFDRLWLATAINRFNAAPLRISEAEWKERAGTDSGDASSKLRRLRLALSLIQSRAKRRLTDSAFALAAFFVAAIVILEVHIEFKQWWAMVGYVLLFALILGIHVFARGRRFQQHTEDYRAVAEALRVQLVWWDAGLSGPDCRVDRTYLGATGGSLGRVRTAVRHLIDSALLMASGPKAVPGSEERWIAGQIKFFESRNEARHASLSLIEDLTWFLFVGSFGMSAFIASLAAFEHRTISILNWMFDRLGPHGLLVAGVPAVVGLFVLHRVFWSFVRQMPLPSALRAAVKALNSLPAVIAGFVASAALADVAMLFTHSRWIFDRHSTELAHELALITMVGTAALAGAMRFFAEKLSREHELFSYRDALVTFKRAQEELDQLAGDMSQAAEKRRRELLVAIGKEALEENEAWIRAHRLRPLEPVVGG